MNAELKRLVQQGVLKNVDYSNWAAPIVVVAKKNGSVRICADFKTGLKEALEMHQHPLPTPDEIFARLNQGAWFTQIDFADAYLQMEVEDDSKERGTGQAFQHISVSSVSPPRRRIQMNHHVQNVF